MVEDWQVALLMAKAKEADLLARVDIDRKNKFYIKSKNPKVDKKNHTYPLYYPHFQKIGKMMIKLGANIENRFKTTDYHLKIIRLEA